MRNDRTQKGITIVALIITIIVLLILSVVTIKSVQGDGIIGHAKIAALKQELAVLKEEYGLFCTEKEIETRGKFSQDTLMASKETLVYNEKEAQGQNIYNVMPSLESSRYKEKTEIINGAIYVATTNKKEAEILEEFGILANPFRIENGVLMSDDDNLALLGEDGILVIPASVKKIDAGAFTNLKDKNIKKVIIPGTVKEIGANAFSNNQTLEEVVMEEGIEKINNSAFESCNNLKKAQMPNTISELGDAVFYRDINLESINIPINEKLTTIPSIIFSNCRKLKEIIIPDNIVQIEGEAFVRTAITTLRIPKNVQKINPSAMEYCDSLENIEVDPENQHFDIKNGILLMTNDKKDRTEMIYIVGSAIKGNTFDIPDGVTSVSGRLIQKYNNVITKVKIPSSVISLSTNFFNNNTNITEIEIASGNPNYMSTSKAIYDKKQTQLIYYYAKDSEVTIPEGVTTLNSYSFYMCKDSLKTVNLPQSLTTINSHTFNGCKILTTLNLGAKVQKIYALSIYNSGITEIIVDKNNPYLTAENRMLFNKDKTKLIAIVYPESITTFTIPDGVQEIESSVFHARSSLKNVIIPDTVTKIGSSFQMCTGLETITIPKNVKEISTSCFDRCSNLKEIIIQQPPNSLSGAPWGATLGGRVNIKWNG